VPSFLTLLVAHALALPTFSKSFAAAFVDELSMTMDNLVKSVALMLCLC
jgi:hypothetical protein